MEQFDELDPLLFCGIWGLSYEEASEHLRIKARTLAAYACQGSSTHRNPSASVKALAAARHNNWIREGKQPQNLNLLLTAC